MTLKVTAKVDPPWHIYKYSNEQPDDGPKLTSFDLFDPAGPRPQGGLDAVEAADQEEGHGLQGPRVPRILRGRGLLEPPAGGPGRDRARQEGGPGPGRLHVCTDDQLQPAGPWTLPAAELTVVAGGPPPRRRPRPPRPRPTSPGPTGAARRPRRRERRPPTAGRPDAGRPATSASKPEDGFLPFLLFCAGGGLFALAMPCVWPMIPVTVNFFVKQGQKKNGLDDRAGDHLLPVDHR